MERLVTDVLVVGAGPTGLMLANWLARLGVETIVVDSKRGPTNESRALGVQARSMEIYDQLGVIDEVLEQSTHAAFLAPGFGRKRFARVPVGEFGRGLTPYPRISILEQSRNERILLDALVRTGRDVLWEHELEALEVASTSEQPSADAVARPVIGTIARRDGARIEVSARYCIGADGGSSRVRKLREIPFAGHTNEHVFYVCDARDVSGITHGGINVRFGETDLLLTFPMGGDDARLLGVVRADSATDEASVVESSMKQRIAGVFGVDYSGSNWFATYRIHHRVASRFRDGPVFLAGDAAHVHSPVGAQGMNTGLQDAHNLAMKLADVVHGRAGDQWLDRYEAERRPVAEVLTETTDRIFAFVTDDRPVSRMLRRRVIPIVAKVLARVVPRLAGENRLFQYVGQLRIHYWMSDEERRRSGGRRDAVVGRRLAWVPGTTGSNFDALRTAEWQVHEYGSVDPAVVERLTDRLQLPVHVYRAAPKTALQPGVFYLVRPDGFVAAQARAADAVDVFTAALPWVAHAPSSQSSV